MLWSMIAINTLPIFKSSMKEQPRARAHSLNPIIKKTASKKVPRLNVSSFFLFFKSVKFQSNLSEKDIQYTLTLPHTGAADVEIK